MNLKEQLSNFFTLDLRKVDWGRTILLVLLILAIAAALWQWLMPQIRTIETTVFRKVPGIHGAEDVRRSNIACPDKGIVVLDKRDLAKKLSPALLLLPGPAISSPAGPAADTGVLTAGDPLTSGLTEDGEIIAGGPLSSGHTEVTATADLPASDNGYEELAVIDMYTGESQIMAREKAAPWFQFLNRGAVGIRYGFDQRLTNVGDVYGRWDFLRIKDIYFSANANLETGGDAKMQLGAEYRW